LNAVSRISSGAGFISKLQVFDFTNTDKFSTPRLTGSSLFDLLEFNLPQFKPFSDIMLKEKLISNSNLKSKETSNLKEIT
jgi:hypothetical protein